MDAMECDLADPYQPCAAGRKCLHSRILTVNNPKRLYPCVRQSARHGGSCGHCVSCYFLCPCDSADAAHRYECKDSRLDFRNTTPTELVQPQPAHGISALWAKRQRCTERRRSRKPQRTHWRQRSRSPTRRKAVGLSLHIFKPAAAYDLGEAELVGQVDMWQQQDGSWQRLELLPMLPMLPRPCEKAAAAAEEQQRELLDRIFKTLGVTN